MSIKKVLTYFTLFLLILFKLGSISYATEPLKIQITPMACQGNSCPDIMRDRVYSQMDPPEACAATYEDFLRSPQTLHFWAEDPEITSQGKADERARQFIYWVLNKNAIDDHPVIRQIWSTTSSVAFVFMLVIAAVMGLGFIIAQKANFQLNIKIWPYVTKLLLALAYIFFSWIIVLSLIQISEWIMRLFIDNLGGKDLFNVYFDSASGSSEKNYTNFIGCRDLNIRVQEGADAQNFLFKATNFTYYVMGIMLILRKILLWFLLFVSPFLAVLFPFVFIRNIGWVWIGVFFQWLFYGPLFALFLGALNKMWSVGIPFTFDFSRVNDIKGYVYPTALILTYGGPAQRGETAAIGALNNGSYVDTFAEYVITLIMLWAVIVFPWFLLHIFRDYCCDGIYAMKNILLSLYDHMRGLPQNPNAPSTPKPSQNLNIKMAREINTNTQVKLETLQEIKKTRTEDITKSMNLSATKITDIARFETDKTTKETVTKNLNYLSNPTKAETPNERQKYMNIRTELFNRAIKDDRSARQILSVTSNSTIERQQKREEILKTTPQSASVTNVVSVKVQMPKEKVSSVNTSLVNSISNHSQVMNTISENTTVPVQQVQTILTSLKQNIESSPTQILLNIVKETGLEKQKIQNVIQQVKNVIQTQVTKSFVNAIYKNTTEVNTLAQTTQLSTQQVQNVLEQYESQPDVVNANIDTISTVSHVERPKVVQIMEYITNKLNINKSLIKEIALKENIREEDVTKIMDTQIPMIVEPEKSIEQTITIPASVSIEDYEEVKKMWVQQYEKGEVPVTENMKDRNDWINQDIVFISNTLNKLLSSDEKLRQEGIDELGYILPIFIINNLKGEELMVYLKAKLEAAKEVEKNLGKEKEIEERLKAKMQSDQDLVEVQRPVDTTVQNDNHLEQELEMPKDEEIK